MGRTQPSSKCNSIFTRAEWPRPLSLDASMNRVDLQRRAQEYADSKQLIIAEQLGYGLHGIVFAANYQTKAARCAIKTLAIDECYRRERDIYLHLQRKG